MFVAELGEGAVEAVKLLKALIVTHRILYARHALEAITCEMAFVHGVQAAPREAPLFVNKEVVHHATQPGSRLVYLNEIIEFAEGPEQQFLKQIFRLGLGACQPPGEAVEAIEVRSHESLESQILFRGTHNVPECSAAARPNKGAFGRLRVGITGQAHPVRWEHTARAPENKRLMMITEGMDFRVVPQAPE